MLVADIGLSCAALFTGAALYINVAEQPAWLLLDDRCLLTQWKPAYRRGFLMQSSLAVLGFVFGTAAWWQSGVASFLIAGMPMLANWPWTMLAILPTNRVLMETPIAAADAATRRLIETRNSLHAVRTILGGLALVAFLWGSRLA